MQRIGPYELRGELGRGGMGAVYRAWDPALAREVALKVLLAQGIAPDPDEVARFQREAQALGRLRHPHLIAVHAAGSVKGQLYLVMDLLPGGSLADRLKREGPLEPREAARLMARVAGGLRYAQERGVLHRDLKPANVLLDADGDPVLTDFGLARLATDREALTRSGEVVGTPGSMSPEQALGDPRAIGPGTDVYGAGATLYELLTGSPPFRRASVLDTLRAVIEDPAVPPSRLRPELDPKLEAICLACLAKDPAERYPDAGALARALEAWLCPPDGDAPERAPGRPAAAALALALGGAIGLAAGVWAGSQEPAALPVNGPDATSVAAQASGHTDSSPVELATGTGERPGADGPGSAAEEHEPDASASISLADRLARAEELEGDTQQRALDALIAANGPLLARAHDLRASLFLSRGAKVEGSLDLERALALHAGDELERRMNLANSCREAGRYAAALAHADAALELLARPGVDDPTALMLMLVNRGDARRYLGDDEGAVSDLTRALQLAPDYFWALISRGQALSDLGRTEQAATDFRRAMDQHRDGPRASSELLETALICFALAMLRAGPEWSDELRSALHEALGIRPDNPISLVVRAKFRAHEDDRIGALRDLERASRHEAAGAHRAEAELLFGRPDDALATLDAIQETRDPANVFLVRARALLVRAERVLALNTSERVRNADLQRVQAELKLVDEAAERALQHDRSCVEAHVIRAQVQLAAGAFAAARAEAQRALEIDDTCAPARVVIGWSHLQAAPERASAYAQAVLDRDPQDPEALLLRAYARFTAKDHVGADEDLREAEARLLPGSPYAEDLPFLRSILDR